MSRRTASQRLRLALLGACLAVVVAASGPTGTSVPAGIAVAALGEAVRIWAAGHLVKTTRLVISGPYRYTRNPMYLGRLLLGTGILVAAWLPRGLTLVLLPLFWAGFLGLYLRRKERVEPERLERRHGAAYRRYRREVPALVPRLTPWPAGGTTRWSAARFRESREALTLAGVVALFVLLALRAG